jgi:hypothetical protein
MITKQDTSNAWDALTNAFKNPNQNKSMLILIAMVGFFTVLIIKLGKFRIWQPKPKIRRRRRAPRRRRTRKRRR